MKYTIKVLHDPVQDVDLPRLVSWGDGYGALTPRASTWLRELEQAGLKPLVRQSLVVGGLPQCEHVARFLVENIMRWAGTYPSLPQWYLGSAWWVPCASPSTSPRAVIRVSPDGETERYRSIYEAARAVGSNRAAIRKWIRAGVADPQGCLWRDHAETDLPVSSQITQDRQAVGVI